MTKDTNSRKLDFCGSLFLLLFSLTSPNIVFICFELCAETVRKFASITSDEGADCRRSNRS